MEIDKKLPAEAQTESPNVKTYRNGIIRATLSHEHLLGVASHKARTFEILADQVIDFNHSVPTLRAGWSKLCKDKLPRVLETIFQGTDNVNEEECYPLIAAVKAFDFLTGLGDQYHRTDWRNFSLISLNRKMRDG